MAGILVIFLPFVPHSLPIPLFPLLFYFSFVLSLEFGQRVHAHLRNHNFRLEPTVCASLLKMYTKCNDPKQVVPIWSDITKQRINLDATLYTSLLSACAEWAKAISVPSEASGDPDQPVGNVLELGQQIHEHIVKTKFR